MLYWEKNSLEAFPSKRAVLQSCLLTVNRYRKLVLEVQGRRESQGELPRRSLDRNTLHWPSATAEIMESFFEAGWEISSKWLKVNVCYSLGLGVEFQKATCDEEGCNTHVGALYSP
jgi:hypothetical protein